MIVFYAGILVKDRDELGSYTKGFIKHICLLAPIIGLLLLQPHFSASIVIIGICSIMMIMSAAVWEFFRFRWNIRRPRPLSSCMPASQSSCPIRL